ncbi:hypothetical protein [Labilibaculum antarcticum]|uniref:Uncharacterized protein n=1 Tax=Labilibaculum antarcticum TaxID=1717717 RepID=A0A1Y1CF35_9BACT|nr:hypothetical protein [Labilibaculum antarcticum]BAX78713.1 hypothetical protein ALGA_0318 [Labilibaculum antarcticum]
MKRLSKLLLIIAILGLGFNSCEKEKSELAGEIPGMGNAVGELEVEKYDFHEDLVFSPIIGVGDNLKSASFDEVVIEGVAQGSGDEVVVTLTITNTNSAEWRSVYLRAGTVFEVNLPGYQNGISLAPVVICLSPGEERIVTLYLYCLNAGKSDSDDSASYKLLGVTQSEVMMELVNTLQGKMVNYEDYMIYYGDGAGSFYNDVKDMLQKIVWHITNGAGMTDEDYKYINSLPELPQGVLPEGIYDLGFVLPASWCADCRLETAWGGAFKGEGRAWWFYYDASVGGQQAIYAGQYVVDGAYVEYVNGEIRIELGDSMSLIDDDEAVKIKGYDTLPTTRPAAGHFTYKGTDLTVPVDEYAYYAVHLDVAVCN